MSPGWMHFLIHKPEPVCLCANWHLMEGAITEHTLIPCHDFNFFLTPQNILVFKRRRTQEEPPPPPLPFTAAAAGEKVCPEPPQLIKNESKKSRRNAQGCKPKNPKDKNLDLDSDHDFLDGVQVGAFKRMMADIERLQNPFDDEETKEMEEIYQQEYQDNHEEQQQQQQHPSKHPSNQQNQHQQPNREDGEMLLSSEVDFDIEEQEQDRHSTNEVDATAQETKMKRRRSCQNDDEPFSDLPTEPLDHEQEIYGENHHANVDYEHHINKQSINNVNINHDSFPSIAAPENQIELRQQREQQQQQQQTQHGQYNQYPKAKKVEMVEQEQLSSAEATKIEPSLRDCNRRRSALQCDESKADQENFFNGASSRSDDYDSSTRPPTSNSTQRRRSSSRLKEVNHATSSTSGSHAALEESGSTDESYILTRAQKRKLSLSGNDEGLRTDVGKVENSTAVSGDGDVRSKRRSSIGERK
jgi:hypothetical protein